MDIIARRRAEFGMRVLEAALLDYMDGALYEDELIYEFDKWCENIQRTMADLA